MKNLILVCLSILTLSLISCNEDDAELSADNEVISVSISDGTTQVDLSIDNENQTITGSVPYDFQLSEVTISIDVSDLATISINTNETINLTSPVTFTVGAENGDEVTYTIDVTRGTSPEKQILKFEINLDGISYLASINNDDFIVRDTFPYTTSLASLTPSIVVSDYASVNPSSDETQDFSESVIYTVTAEDGTTQAYSIELYQEKSSENDLISFQLKGTEITNIIGVIDAANSTVDLKVPNTVDLSNVIPLVTSSEYSTLSVDFSTGVDLTEDYEFNVIAEDGSSKSYTVRTEFMNIAESISHEEGSASKWFGGDNRVDFTPRNIGTGQSVLLEETMHIQSFSVHFTRDFDFVESVGNMGHEVEIILEIRNTDGDSLTSTSLINPSSFNGGWILFDLSDRSILLEGDKEYVFLWYLPNGLVENYSSGSSGDASAAFAGGKGYSIVIDSSSDSITDWSNWFEHPWDFWFRFEGLK